MSALIDVAAANVSLEVLVASVAGAGVGAVVVGAGRVLSTVRQDWPGEPVDKMYSRVISTIIPSRPVVSTLVNVHAPPVSASTQALVSSLAVLVSLTPVTTVTTLGLGGAPPPIINLSYILPRESEYSWDILRELTRSMFM